MYDNKHLQKIKRREFILQLEKDVKYGKSTAAHRLYARLQKLPGINEKAGRSTRNSHQYRIRGAKTAAAQISNIHEKYIRQQKVTEIQKKCLGLQPETQCKELGGYIAKYSDVTVTEIDERSAQAYETDKELQLLGEDGCIKVALWLEHQNHVKSNCDRGAKHKFPESQSNTKLSKYYVDTDCFIQADDKTSSTYDTKMHVFRVDIPTVYQHKDINKQSKLAKYDEVADVSKNVYNKLNHKIQTCMWCPCLLFFVFIFCVPALFYMHKSDKFYHRQCLKKAYMYGKMSTVLFCCGLLTAVIFYSALLLFVAYLSQNSLQT